MGLESRGSVLRPLLVCSTCLNAAFIFCGWKELNCPAACACDGNAPAISDFRGGYRDTLVDADYLDSYFGLRQFSAEEPSLLQASGLDHGDTRWTSTVDGWDDSPTGVVDFRRLGASNVSGELINATTSSSHGSSHAGHHAHQHDALVFMFCVMVVGVAVLHVTSYFPQVPFTVVLFLFGVFAALLLEGTKLKDKIGIWGDSWTMWVNIDPHLLLFTLLPALLAGDAMTIDTTVFKRIKFQVLFLAGPGVAIQAFSVAFLLWLYMQSWDWSFPLCVAVGSILCATDPVAVVALLKQLGASPVLTVQIQGEALCNDGTAIVFFLISYNVLRGESYDAISLCMFVVQKVMMATALGFFTGFAFFAWIRSARNTLSHDSSLIQIILTICAAYISFVLAEGVFKMSGVLACVGCSLVLADNMWPHIVSVNSLHHVWHTIEAIGNILIFSLAGVLTGVAITRVDARAFLDLFLIYIVLFIIRTTFLFASKPLLTVVGEPISAKDAAVMAWGGLRGAVGLALAVQVRNERASDKNGKPKLNDRDAEHVFFYVGGVALLTLIINATTCKNLVEWLGITALPLEQLRLLRMVHTGICELAGGHVPPGLRHVVGMTENDDTEFPEVVKQDLQGMLEETQKDINNLQIQKVKHDAQGSSTSQVQSIDSLIAEWEELRATYHKMKDMSHMTTHRGERLDMFERLGGHRDLFDHLGCEEVQKMTELLLRCKQVDYGMARVINTAFLKMVENNYRQLIKSDVLRLNSELNKSLFMSISVALGWSRITDLTDFAEIKDHLPVVPNKDLEGDQHLKIFEDASSRQSLDQVGKKSSLRTCIESTTFNMVFLVLILLNCIFILIDELYRKDSKGHVSWLVVEIIFNVIFLVEFLMKFVDRGLSFFKRGQDCFDFLLVVLGIVSVTTGLLERSGDMDAKADSTGNQIMRFARIFRAMRLMRVFRLLSAKIDMGRDVSVEVEMHNHRLNAMICFANAHLKAQRELVIFFGGNAKVDDEDEKEIARCIIQSQIAVFKACKIAVDEEKALGQHLMADLRVVVWKKGIADAILKFITAAHKAGAISAIDAHKVRHPLDHYLGDLKEKLKDLDLGIIEKERRAESDRSLDDDGMLVSADVSNGHSRNWETIPSDDTTVTRDSIITGSGVHSGKVAFASTSLGAALPPVVEAAPLPPVIPPEMHVPTVPGMLGHTEMSDDTESV